MREADALKGMEKKPTFQNIFLLLYKKHTLPFLSPPTQPPRKLYTVCWARVTEGFCLAPCPQAELSAPGPFIRRHL